MPKAHIQREERGGSQVDPQPLGNKAGPGRELYDQKAGLAPSTLASKLLPTDGLSGKAEQGPEISAPRFLLAPAVGGGRACGVTGQSSWKWDTERKKGREAGVQMEEPVPPVEDTLLWKPTGGRKARLASVRTGWWGLQTPDRPSVPEGVCGEPWGMSSSWSLRPSWCSLSPEASPAELRSAVG